MEALSFRSLLVFSALFRIFLILYGEWQDTHMEVRYTDVDYLVFSVAASLMAAGRSPYERLTYRYSPLIAFLLLPNSIIHPPSWGKFLFSASGKICQAAFWYGLVVQMRIYPIIYALPMILVLDPLYFNSGKKPNLAVWFPRDFMQTTQSSFSTEVSDQNSIWLILSSMFTWRRIIFGLISGLVFFFCTGFSFYLYGWKFLHEALLYHLTRTDPRHNFSIYLYHLCLHYEYVFTVLEKLISFLPQVIVQLVLVFRFSDDFPFCYFVQTLAFVAFNKVITAQYFVWFFCLLPLILPWTNMKLKWQGLALSLIWIGTQTHWLMWGYLLEFKGKNVFIQLWLASIAFLAANTWILICIIRHHKYTPVFRRFEHSTSEKVVKHD